jgi:aldehyde dehydrogenase (NAD+)
MSGISDTRTYGGVYLAGRRDGRGNAAPLIDPSTAETFGEMRMADRADVDEVVSAASAAALPWKERAPVERSRVCRRVADLILDRREMLTELVVRDAGLPLSIARREVETASRYFEYYAGLADKLFGDSIPLGPTAIDFTVRDPWGVCAIILPFNFPLQLTARDLAPALATGNTVVLKPPEQAPLAALALAALCGEAGAPDGAVTAVTGLGQDVGEALVRHPQISHVTFTGSAATAQRVLEATASTITPTTVELGGKSPHIIFADAEIERAVETIVNTTFKTAGQACSAGTRFLVDRRVHDEFVTALRAALASLRVGPAASDPAIGPLISAAQRDDVVSAIAAAEVEGVLVTRGQNPSDSRGYFVSPTLLDNVYANAPAAQEEIFGPVAAVVTFTDEAEAVALANATRFGLVVGIWTRDVGRALRVAQRIDAGQVFVNSYGVGGGVELPFGGYKRSGFGRVKGVAGAVEYTQIKNICIDTR